MKALINEITCLAELEKINDPEIPVLSIIDLGIVRKIKIDAPASIDIYLSATYTACPATDLIKAEVHATLLNLGFEKINIQQVISPPWSTDLISEEGKAKLKEYGIAPPDKRFSIPTDGITCPRCSSSNTKLKSEFGSTACKAFYQCLDCLEPFDYFKCH
jgi:ring-1,2-phenylacetyl-CoA epoxidase subunit PaaD